MKEPNSQEIATKLRGIRNVRRLISLYQSFGSNFRFTSNNSKIYSNYFPTFDFLCFKDDLLKVSIETMKRKIVLPSIILK